MNLGYGFATTTGSSGTAPINLASPDRTVTSTGNETILASDMAGQVNYNCSACTATIPAISSTVFAAGATLVIVNTNATALAISSTPTINGYAPTSLPQYGGLALTSNGTSLDAVALGGGGGGGISTVTGGGNTQTSATTLAGGNGLCTTNGSSGTAPLNLCSITDNAGRRQLSVPPLATWRTETISLATTGSPVLTLPAASSTIFAAGMTYSFVVTGTVNWTLTNSTGLTLTGLNSQSTLVPGTSGTFVANANGTGLDFFPGMQPPTSTALGGVISDGASISTSAAGVLSVASSGITTAKIAAAAVTYAKMQNGASTGLLGVNNGSAPTEVAVGSGLSLAGSTLSATGGGSGVPAVGNTTPVTVNANITTDQLLQELHPANGSFNTANMVIRFHQSGIFTTASLSTPALTVKVKLCSSSNSGRITLSTITTSATVTATNNQRSYLRLRVEFPRQARRARWHATWALSSPT